MTNEAERDAEHFMLVYEAREWANFADKGFEVTTPAVRELKIQATKLDRMIIESLRSFEDVVPVKRATVPLSALLTAPTQIRSMKKLRKKQGQRNHAIERQRKKLLVVAEKAIRELYKDEQRESEIRKLIERSRDLIRTGAVQQFNATLKRVRESRRGRV